MDPGRDAGGVAGTVLIPMRFVWPYGGRSVFLCGSFTRWIFCSLLHGHFSFLLRMFWFSFACLSFHFKFYLKGGLSFYRCRQWKVVQPCFKLFIICHPVTIRSVYGCVTSLMVRVLRLMFCGFYNLYISYCQYCYLSLRCAVWLKYGISSR